MAEVRAHRRMEAERPALLEREERKYQEAAQEAIRQAQVMTPQVRYTLLLYYISTG